MKLLDQVSMLPGARERAFDEFQSGRITFVEAMQGIARELLQAGWLPRRLNVSSCRPAFYLKPRPAPSGLAQSSASL